MTLDIFTIHNTSRILYPFTRYNFEKKGWTISASDSFAVRQRLFQSTLSPKMQHIAKLAKRFWEIVFEDAERMLFVEDEETFNEYFGTRNGKPAAATCHKGEDFIVFGPLLKECSEEEILETICHEFRHRIQNKFGKMVKDAEKAYGRIIDPLDISLTKLAILATYERETWPFEIDAELLSLCLSKSKIPIIRFLDEHSKLLKQLLYMDDQNTSEILLRLSEIYQRQESSNQLFDAQLKRLIAPGKKLFI